MSFERHAGARTVRPPVKRLGERRQQHVVDLRAIGGRNLREQPARVLGVEPDLERAERADDDCALLVIDGKCGLGQRERRPVCGTEPHTAVGLAAQLAKPLHPLRERRRRR